MGISSVNEYGDFMGNSYISGKNFSFAEEPINSKESYKKDSMQEIKSSNSMSFCEKHQNDASLCDCLPPVLDDMAEDCLNMVGISDSSNVTLNQLLCMNTDTNREFSSTTDTTQAHQKSYDFYSSNKRFCLDQKNDIHQTSFHTMTPSSNTKISPYAEDTSNIIFFEPQTQEEEIYSNLLPSCTTKLEHTCQLNTPTFGYLSSADALKSTEFCNCPGRFDFSLKKFINDPNKPITKSIPFTYSPTLDKIFYKEGVEVPIVFKFNKDIPPSSKVFITIMFKKQEYKHQPVHRCAVHVDQKSIHPERFMTLKRDDNPSNYDCFHEGHDSVNFEVGTTGRDGQLVVMGEFHCLNSCVSGYRRRDLVMLCQLYYHGEILGTSFCDIHVSTSPGRDRKTKEEKALNLSSQKKKSCSSVCCKEEKQYFPIAVGKGENNKNQYKIEIKRKHLQTVMNFVRGMAGLEVDKIKNVEKEFA